MQADDELFNKDGLEGERAAYIDEIHALHTAIDKIFSGHDGAAVCGACSIIIAKWIIAHPIGARSGAVAAHIKLVSGLAAQMAGQATPFIFGDNDDGNPNCRHR